MSTDASRTITAPSSNGASGAGGPGGAVPAARSKPGTYIAETYAGELDATSGGTPALANDGEPAGLARVTLAMRPESKEPPAPGRLVGLCAWAALIGIVGLVIAIRSGYAVLAGAPGWFTASAPIIGLVGFASTVGAFVTARWWIMPWALLGVATCTIVVALVLVLNL